MSSANASGSREKSAHPDPRHVVARWHGDPSTLVPVREGANVVYAFRAGGSRAFLRLTSDDHRGREQVDAEIELVRFVASRGVAAARPLCSTSGAWVESLSQADGTPWHAVAFEAVPGRHFRYFSSDIDRPLFHAWGAAMGALHAASRDFVPATARRPAWSEQDTTSCNPDELPAEEIDARREHARIVEWLDSLDAPPHAWGVIHGDFERTNFTLASGVVRIYDFDDACYHWFLADVANALWAFRNAPATDRRQFLAWFLDGYREHSPVDDDAGARVSWFVRLRSLSLFIHHRRGGSGLQSDDEWVRRMRAALATPFWW